MSGITNLRDAFTFASNGTPQLQQVRMRYGEGGVQVLEFDVAHGGGVHTLTRTLPAGARMHHLTAEAVQMGTMAREGAAAGKPVHEWAPQPVSAELVSPEIPEPQRSEVVKAINQIQSGDYELVHDLAHDKAGDPNPPVFF